MLQANLVLSIHILHCFRQEGSAETLPWYGLLIRYVKQPLMDGRGCVYLHPPVMNAYTFSVFRNLWFLSSCLFPCPPVLPSIPHTLTGSCVHYSCEAIDCPEPLIRNADLRCSSPGRHFYNGDRCTISCHSGYVLQIHQDDDLIKSQVNTPPPYTPPYTPDTQKRAR